MDGQGPKASSVPFNALTVPWICSCPKRFWSGVTLCLAAAAAYCNLRANF